MIFLNLAKFSGLIISLYLLLEKLIFNRRHYRKATSLNDFCQSFKSQRGWFGYHSAGSKRSFRLDLHELSQRGFLSWRHIANAAGDDHCHVSTVYLIVLLLEPEDYYLIKHLDLDIQNLTWQLQPKRIQKEIQSPVPQSVYSCLVCGDRPTGYHYGWLRGAIYDIVMSAAWKWIFYGLEWNGTIDFMGMKFEHLSLVKK
ncbi:hypothetical protein BpHYR1_046121 [Brachionus plicatilis]|uniref:Uncharacterized protein n=1 Tax=Brachionus plicatilis TaxID=10195 RepID=A0A3M7P5V3_BRAPC|nr:hypothetical protein BpHYR1_046121 [Brachionus plicatilis]